MVSLSVLTLSRVADVQAGSRISLSTSPIACLSSGGVVPRTFAPCVVRKVSHISDVHWRRGVACSDRFQQRCAVCPHLCQCCGQFAIKPLQLDDHLDKCVEMKCGHPCDRDSNTSPYRWFAWFCRSSGGLGDEVPAVREESCTQKSSRL